LPFKIPLEASQADMSVKNRAYIFMTLLISNDLTSTPLKFRVTGQDINKCISKWIITEARFKIQKPPLICLDLVGDIGSNFSSKIPTQHILEDEDVFV